MVVSIKRAGVRFVSIVLCLGLLGSLAAAQSSPPWAWGPIVGTVGEDFVSIVWKTSRPVGFDLHVSMAPVYDAAGQWEETLVFERHDGVAEIWLQDLIPGTTYRYQLICYEGDAVYPTEVGSFKTLDQAARSFSFAAYGATASHPDRHKLVADTIAARETIDIVLHAGELVEAGTEDHYDNFFWAIADLARTHPYLTVLGDRDADGGLYYDYFSLPSGGGTSNMQWWSFDAGILCFVGLDSTADAASLQAETVWLEELLAGTATDRILVVLSHDPLYSGAYPSGRSDALADLWEPLFIEYGVDLVISSAVHGYEHIYRRGIHHVSSGGGGAPLIPAPEFVAPGTVFRRFGMLHYLRGTLADAVLRIEAIPVASIDEDTLYLSPSGRSIDTFVIENLP